jgi:hypothetical protein
MGRRAGKSDQTVSGALTVGLEDNADGQFEPYVRLLHPSRG